MAPLKRPGSRGLSTRAINAATTVPDRGLSRPVSGVRQTPQASLRRRDRGGSVAVLSASRAACVPVASDGPAHSAGTDPHPRHIDVARVAVGQTRRFNLKLPALGS
jgi:hypothetical protein